MNRTDAHGLWARLEQALADTSDVYINAGVDEAAYCAGLAEHIREHRCEPFQVSARVVPPGFPDAEVGSTLTGLCLAHCQGYWLVYQPEQDRYYAFWGIDPQHLDAHGVFGSPLYCWSA